MLIVCLLTSATHVFGAATAMQPPTPSQAVLGQADVAGSVVFYQAGGQPVKLMRLGDGPPAFEAPGQALRLVNGSPGQVNVALFEAPGCGPRKWVELRALFRMSKGSHGWGIALVDADRAAEQVRATKAWEEPNIPGCFCVGVDSYDPPTKNWFNAECNIYGRPQREISLHWDGREQVKRLCPVEIRDRKLHTLRCLVDYQIGGAEVSLWIDDKPVYERWFIAEMVPYDWAVAVGGRTGDKSKPRVTVEVLEVAAHYGPPVPPPAKPRYRCRIFDGVVINQKRQKVENVVQLPPPGERFGRIILTLTLDKPPQGIDPWDRGGSIKVFDGDEAYEIQRFITPFGRGYRWKSDVTDYMPLLTGRRKFSVSISTWVGQKGWKVTADLDYYPGWAEPEPFKVKKVWSGFFEYGNPQKPLRSMLPPRELSVPPEAKTAKLRVVVTGHGMHPATNNAGEFFPAWRTVVVNGHKFKNLLWRTDCYLNPCRPQGGTWKFDRAGWCPGSLVRPWDIGLTGIVKPGGKLRIEYIPQKYVNKNRHKAKAWHDVEVQVIYYN